MANIGIFNHLIRSNNTLQKNKAMQTEAKDSEKGAEESKGNVDTRNIMKTDL